MVVFSTSLNTQKKALFLLLRTLRHLCQSVASLFFYMRLNIFCQFSGGCGITILKKHLKIGVSSNAANMLLSDRGTIGLQFWTLLAVLVAPVVEKNAKNRRNVGVKTRVKNRQIFGKCPISQD